MVIYYKNSFLASVVSIAGGFVALAGLATLSDSIILGILVLLGGLAMLVWARAISDDKAFKEWWKQVEENNLEPAIAQDLNVAITIYQKNPDVRTLQKIATLNPSYARYIQENVAKKKKKG